MDIEELIEEALRTNDPELMTLAHQLVKDPLYNFKPRTDQPALLDQQQSFYNDQQNKLLCVLAGNAAGKSEVAAAKVARFLRETPPPRKNTPFWVVSQNLEMSSGVCWREKLSKYIPKDSIKAISWYNQKLDLPIGITMKPQTNGNNWIIEIKSYDMQRHRLQGSGVGGFWCDEQAPYDILMEVWTRCREYPFGGNKLYTLTPLMPDSNLEEIYNTQERHPSWQFYRMNRDCNKTLDPEYIKAIDENELEELRETRRLGVFASFKGAIYKQFNSAIHVIDPIDVPNRWHQARGLDFGWTDPTACIWGSKAPDGTWYITNEYYQHSDYLEDHVEAIKSIPSQGVTWADPSAAQERHELARLGLVTQPAFNEINPGIATVQKFLRGINGKPKLFIFNTCKHLIKEMRMYQWHEFIPNTPKRHQNDHSNDALRYLLAGEERCVQPKWDAPKVNKRYTTTPF